MDTKKQRNMYSSAKYTGRMAMFSLFCAAAGVYAADTTDGWKYKDAEKTVIENTGTGTVSRITPIAKDGKLDDGSVIGSVSKVETSGSETVANFVYDKSLGDESVKGVVFDGAENSLNMVDNSKIKVDATVDSEGNIIEGKSAVGIQFSDTAESSRITGDGEISVSASKEAIAIKGNSIGDITLKSIHVSSGKNLDPDAEKNGTAIGIQASGNVGNINVQNIDTSFADIGKAVDVTGNVGDIKSEMISGDINIKGDAKSLSANIIDGDVHLNNIGDISIVESSLHNGTVNSITVDGNAGNFVVAGVSGDTTISGNAGNVMIGDSGSAKSDAEGTVTYSGDTSIKGEASSVAIETANGNVSLGKVTDGGKNEYVLSKIKSVTGRSDIESYSVAIDTAHSDVTVAENTSGIYVNKIDGKLTAKDSKADVIVVTSNSVDVNLNGGNLEVETVVKDTIVNGTGNATIGNANTVNSTKLDGDMVIGSNSGAVNVGEISGKLVLNDAQNDVKVATSVGSLDATLNGGNLTATKVEGDLNINALTADKIAKIDEIGGNAIFSNIDGKVSATNIGGDANFTGNTKDAEFSSTNVGGTVIVNGEGTTTVQNAHNLVLSMQDGIKYENDALNITGQKVVASGSTVDNKYNLTVNNLAENGSVSAGIIKQDSIIDGFKGNVSIAESKGVNVKNGLDGNLSIVNAGGAVNVDGGANDIFIVNSSSDITVKGGVNESLRVVGTTAGNVTADTVGGELYVGALKAGKAVKAKEVGTASIGGEGTIDIAKAGSLTANTTNGKLTITNQKVVTDGKLLVKSTEIAEDGSVKLGTLDKASTVDNFNGDLSIKSAADLTVTKGIAGNLTIQNANGIVKVDGGVEKFQVANTATKAITITGGAQDVFIGTANGAVNITGVAGTTDGVANDMQVLFANENITVDTVGKDLTVNTLKTGKTVKANEVVGTATIGGEGTIDIAKAGSLVAGTTDGKLTITNQKVATDGKLLVKGTTVSEGGNVELGTISKESTVDNFNGSIAINATKDKVTVTNGANMDLSISSADKLVDLKGDTKSVKIGLNGSSKGDIVLSADNVGEVVISGTGSADIEKSNSVVINNVDGSLKIAGQTVALDSTTLNVDVTSLSEGGSLNVGNLSEAVNIKEDFNGNVSITNTEKAVTVEGENANLNLTIANAQDNVTIDNANSVNVTLDSSVNSDVKLTVADAVDVNVQGNGTADITSAKLDVSNENVYITNNESNKFVLTDTADQTVATFTTNATIKDGGDLNVKNIIGDNTVLTDFAGNLTAETSKSIELGSIESLKIGTVDGDIIANGDAETVDITKVNKVNLQNVGTLKITEANGDVAINGNAGTVDIKKVNNVGLNDVNSLTIAEANGDVIVNGDAETVDIAKVNKVNLQNVGTLKITEANGDVTINGNADSVNVGLKELDDTQTANLVVKGNVKNLAQVNGGCDATFENAGQILVDTGLDGKLTVNGNVGDEATVLTTPTVSIKNVNETEIKGTVYGDIKASYDDATPQAVITLNQVNGSLNVDSSAVAVDLGVNKVSGDVSLTSAVSKLSVNGEVEGMVKSTGNLNLATESGAKINKIEAAGTVSVDNSNIRLNPVSDDLVMKAAKISGIGAKELMNALYGEAYSLNKTDSTVVGKDTLVGEHNKGKIQAEIGSDVTTDFDAFDNIEGEYFNIAGTNLIGYRISNNTHFASLAKSANESAMAKMLDSIAVSGDDATDASAGTVKQNYYGMDLSAALPQSVSRAARMNMDLANLVHLDTIYRTSSTRDMLDAYGKALKKHVAAPGEMVRGTTMVSVRNMNRFASYGGDSNAAGSNDYIFGGLANVEYIANEDLFGGLGIGGFEAKSDGKGSSGKAETQSIVVNLYGDYAFYENFDWYFGITYAHGMNEAERQRGIETAKASWDSNMIGVFTGVRYAWRPLDNKNFVVKPLIGLNGNFLLNPSFSEDSGIDTMSVDSANYTSVKSIVGVEVNNSFDNGFFLAGRMFYTHEFGDKSYNLNATLSDGFQALGSFHYNGYEMDRDAGVFGIGMGYNINTDWRVYLDYAAEVSSDIYHNLNAGVQFKF